MTKFADWSELYTFLNDHGSISGLRDESLLLGKLIGILAQHVGETGQNEGAVNVLNRLLLEHDCVAEIERLRPRLAMAEATIDGCSEALVKMKDERDVLRAENERLRAALVKHHDLLSDEPGDACQDCGLEWDGRLARDKRA